MELRRSKRILQKTPANTSRSGSKQQRRKRNIPLEKYAIKSDVNQNKAIEKSTVGGDTIIQFIYI